MILEIPLVHQKTEDFGGLTSAVPCRSGGQLILLQQYYVLHTIFGKMIQRGRPQRPSPNNNSIGMGG